jgi:hypothetical protein
LGNVGNGVRTVIVEDASRFGRTLMIQGPASDLGVGVVKSRGEGNRQ